MKALLISLLTILMVPMALAAAPQAPAGYLVSIKLAGEDAAVKTVVVRDGTELAGKLMMPLFEGDVVFVRDPASAVGIELGDGTTMTLGQGVARFEMKGEIDTGDGTWGILSAIGGVFADEDQQAPENMAAKGASLKMPMAVRGTNLLSRDRKSLWLTWEGGKAPFAVSLETASGETPLLADVSSNSAAVPIETVKAEKFTLIIRDAEQQKLPLRFRLAAQLPAGLPVTGSSQASLLAAAAWLSGHKGWSIEAAQVLQAAGTDAALALRDKIAGGWTYQASAP